MKYLFQNQILKLFQQTIWQERNHSMIQEELSNNITHKTKYNPKKVQKTNQTTPTNPNPFATSEHLMSISQTINYQQTIKTIEQQLNYQ